MSIKSILGFLQELKSKLIIIKLIFDRRTPLITKVLFLLAMIYFLLPIDFFPDVSLITGLIDDFIIVPLLIYLGYKLIPDKVKKDYENH
ncbi:DUF1232 domain-containing protein [Candidatus Microgenomates bacterium]|nr:DUF1232 domain-containing protein [Candidatus Microgenomates bacterium]